MRSAKKKRGEVVTLLLFAAFTATVVAVLAARGIKEGSNLYPERAYPYQGKLMIGTNEFQHPTW